MAGSTTTLCIDEANIRLMVTRGKRISKLASVPLETGLSEIDTPEKEQELSERVRQLFRSNKISEKKVVLGLSGLRCLTRPVTLPELPKAMVGEAIVREARRVLPVPPEQLYLSWQVIAASEGKLLAFMIAIPRQVADMLLRVLNGAGLKPYSIEIKPVALARLAREATSIIVDVQPKEFDIIIMVGGLPQPIRTVSFPENLLSIEEKAGIVVAELQKTVAFYNTNNPEFELLPSTPVLLSGEIAEEPQLLADISAQTGFQAELLQSPLKCLKHLDPSQHLANVGLSLKVVTGEPTSLLININSLPEPYQPRQIPANKLLAVPAAAGAIALVFLLVLTIQNAAARLETTRQQLDSANLLIEKRQAEQTALSKEVGDLEKLLDALSSEQESYAQALTLVSSSGENMNTNVSKIVESLVPQLDLKSFNHNAAVAINGNAAGEEEVIEYARELFDTGRFAEITIQTITRPDVESDNVTFSLGVRFEEEED